MIIEYPLFMRRLTFFNFKEEPKGRLLSAGTICVLDLVIRNGKIVTESGVFEADIGIKGSLIVEISKGIRDSANLKIDATNKIILPGVIDGHTHFELPVMGTTSADDYEHGTIAAACGGVTTVIDFATPAKGSNLLETIAESRKKADPKVSVDYSLHLVIDELTRQNFSQIKEVMTKCVQSFKLYTTYKKRGLMLDDLQIYRVMKEVSSRGGIVGLHCENNDFVERLTSEYLEQGKVGPIYHARSKPPESEIEAVRRVLSLAEFARAKVYIVHASTKATVESICEARERGVQVDCETCPHYLTFTIAKYEAANARNYVMSPPLRREEDLAALWRGISNGDVNTIASDHCPFTSQQKDLGKDNFTEIPNGVPGTEVILPILYSEGVGKGRISLTDLVRVSSLNPAKLFGLYPRKGTIQIGSDADLVVFDPKKKQRLTAENLHSRIDFSIYEDIKVTGFPIITISRGRIVYSDNQFTGKKGSGKFVPGALFGSPNVIAGGETNRVK